MRRIDTHTNTIIYKYSCSYWVFLASVLNNGWPGERKWPENTIPLDTTEHSPQQSPTFLAWWSLVARRKCAGEEILTYSFQKTFFHNSSSTVKGETKKGIHTEHDNIAEKWSVTQRGLYGAGSSLGKSARSSNSNVHCRSLLNIRVTETRANTDVGYRRRHKHIHTQACMYI